MSGEKPYSTEYEAGRRHDAVDDSSGGVGRYIVTRFSTLKPPMDRAVNPAHALSQLTTQQWLFFLVSRRRRCRRRRSSLVSYLDFPLR